MIFTLYHMTGRRYLIGNRSATVVKKINVTPKNGFGCLHFDFELPQDNDIMKKGVPYVNYIEGESIYNATLKNTFQPKYFVDDITTHGNKMMMRCTMDVLQTYSELIKEARATLIKTSNPTERGGIKDPRLSNNTWVHDVAKITYPMYFENNEIFNFDDPAKIMITIKGNK